MTKFLLLTLASFGYCAYIFMTSVIPNINPIFPRQQYLNLLAPVLLSISAGLFITNKTKGAGICALVGLTIASKDILYNWLLMDMFPQNYFIKLLIFLILTTLAIFILSYVSIKSLLNPDNKDFFEIIKYRPAGMTAKILSVLPTIIIITATAIFMTTMF